MADTFDPYREALVIERKTVWPAQLQNLPPEVRKQVEEHLHMHPEEATCLQYVKLHAGFCRQITVSSQDLERLGIKIPADGNSASS